MFYPKETLFPIDLPQVMLEKEDDIMLEFTGRKDKNDKEVYEGDILSSTDNYPKPNTVKGIVEQDEYGAWIFGYGYVKDFDGDCEIIGNIYENPELLNK